MEKRYTNTKSWFAATAAIAALLSAAAADDDPVEAGLFDFEHPTCTGEPNEVRVVIEGVKDSIGLMALDLYKNDQESFLKKPGQVDRVRAAAKAPFTRLCLHAPETGDFAIAVYHDENANRKIDTGLIGLPKEPWGLSNDPKFKWRPPQVEESLFHVPETGANVVVTLH